MLFRSEQLGEHTAFRDASQQAKALRAAAGEADPPAQVRVMFAETALAAEDLLLQIRQPGPSGDE